MSIPIPTPNSIPHPEKKMTEISLTPTRYMRKPFYVDGIQVTAENLPAVAAWCKGKIEREDETRGRIEFIRVDVLRPLNDRQTKAFVGDWVLHSDTGFKVYTGSAFSRCFVEPDEDKTPQK